MTVIPRHINTATEALLVPLLLPRVLHEAAGSLRRIISARGAAHL